MCVSVRARVRAKLKDDAEAEALHLRRMSHLQMR
jgi:hypothetical protein